MNAISKTGCSQPVGSRIAVCTNCPDPIGAEFDIVDRAGNVLNVARVTNVTVRSDLRAGNEKFGKYVVQATIVQDLSADDDGPFVTHVYWS